MVSGEKLLNHILIVFQCYSLSHTHGKEILGFFFFSFFLVHLHLLLYYSGVRGLEVRHNDQEVLNIDLLGQVTDPLHTFI